MRLAKRRKVRPDDPVAVVTRFLDAANHHDADGLRSCVHPEFESFQPLHPARNFRGAGQLISNWRAIFEAEPGFRLTLLRASTTGNTVWAEVHGAGASAEAAGIFIVGVEDARIRWIRVYSDLVEPLPEEPVEELAAAGTPAIDWDRDPIRLVPRPESGEAEPAAEGGTEAEPEAEPEEREEPEVAAAGGEPPALRLVGADAGSEEEEAAATTAAEVGAPEVPEAAEAGELAEADEGGGVVAAGGRESIEVLVGEAPEVEAEAEPEPAAETEPETEPAAAAPAADAAPQPTREDAQEASQPRAEGEDEDGEPGGASWDAVAGLGGAAPEPAGDAKSEAQAPGRRRGFLRRGGRR